MSNSNDSIARDIFQERIKKGLLGPGSDIFVFEKDFNEEIIADYPLQRYYTGVLFPDREKVKTFDEKADAELNNETDSEENEVIEQGDENSEISPNENGIDSKRKEPNEDDELKISQNTFFPSNIGLTFCIDRNVKELDVEFSFGLYSQIDEKNDNDLSECKIIFPEHLYRETILENKNFPETLKQKLRYEDGYLLLKKKIEGFKGGKKKRSGDYVIFDEYKREFPKRVETQMIEKLFGRKWKREEKVIKKTIPLSEITIPKPIFERNLRKVKEDYLRASYTVRTYSFTKNPDNIYVKIQLANTSDAHPANQFSNGKELLNQKSIFQAKIKVTTQELKPYKSYIELNPLDKEAEILNYLYKDKFSYGIGHNCSVNWNKPEETIQTTFLPQYDVKDTKNSFLEEDFKDNLNDFLSINESLDIYSLSHFSNKNQSQIIEQLESFVNLYGVWIQEQKNKPSVNLEIEETIFKDLDYNFKRIKTNINLLKTDKVFRAFQLANSAMLIQIIISNDNDFSGKEKDIVELNTNIDYKDIDYFKDFIDKEKDKLKSYPEYKPFIPKYRPFQLAFLLLNIDSITELNSDSRNKIVDLIWFPTGGGKTEAYLAVAAFTIIYRRLINETGFEGTSVIMRYTLRLLTAQQFERASRLIVSLEFLRSHFESELKQSPINIGMWVGMSSTPNTLKEAEEKVEEINEECNKKSGNPESKNVFQISSCPWCGTKLITKNEYGNWDYGFKLTGKNKKAEFKLKCLNKQCNFHNELPIQVVDEMLYETPPTLLFGTVDKFAMLAWKANGHRFFNSLEDDKLPPDLIIQDELHLLTGPLGSITGIFESVIEILCTRDGRKPKIISSTATTRNTNEQIKALYGINIIDLVLATNMISVGIDIERFNIMLINGQPRNIAEYIQASSRVGRKYKGLVIDLLDANRARDKSHFEHFIPFHQAFYKSVEPVSLTPFTENTLEKMLVSIMITYIRHKVPGMASNNSAQYFQRKMLDGLKSEIRNRFEKYPKIYLLFEQKLQELSDDWLYKINEHDLKNYEKTETKFKKEMGLLSKPAEEQTVENKRWTAMQSMREIDTNSFIKIELPYIKNKRNG